jgi:hypothetical protein
VGAATVIHPLVGSREGYHGGAWSHDNETVGIPAPVLHVFYSAASLVLAQHVAAANPLTRTGPPTPLPLQVLSHWDHAESGLNLIGQTRAASPSADECGQVGATNSLPCCRYVVMYDVVVVWCGVV